VGAPESVLQLTRRFTEHYDSYRHPSYNETQLRREFVDPFFKALGWDVDNEQGYAEAYKDVVHEDAIKDGGATKAPDYSFRIGGVRKFFVETKKPSVDIRHDTDPAFQLRRYAWSAKLPLSILTDFEEFAVYDCRIRPDKNDKPSKGRTLYLKFDEYGDRWDEIASIFARESILKGSFDKYAESAKKKRGTAEVDDAFLGEIEQWRSELARNLALRNKKLSQRELNFAVQKTIDRIIFLRICEDRGIEQYGQLQALMNGQNVYARMAQLFQRADDRYNSGLFHFSDKDRTEPPDEWTLELNINDKILKGILRRLYYPESPYEFSVLGADILGQVYEQFLGKVIRLTKGHQARVEDKPEVKKAGGVYYTPTYIVDYIVENTVGKLLEDKQPHEVAARTKTSWKRSKRGRPLSVLDPACGSGSFLIGAYQYLLDWYRDWYVDHNPKQFKDRIYQTRHNEWRLTTAERKRILLDHIYGVDIDPQAVEVTKLSLLLKVLEGENQESLERQMRFLHERALPDLADNIKCGNSLIGPDFYQGQQGELFDTEERLRINAFDWQAEFPEIMGPGGFDAVVGNPPYIRIQTMKQWAPAEVEFFKRAYVSASRGNYDIYVVFVERGLGLLCETGRLGFILPHKFFNAAYGESLRSVLSKGRHMSKIVHFGHQQVFAGATTYTCLLFLERSPVDSCDVVIVNAIASFQRGDELKADRLPVESLSNRTWNVSHTHSRLVLDKLRRMESQLGTIASRMAQGIRTSANDIYVVSVQDERDDVIVAHSKSLNKEVQIDRDSILYFLQGREIKAYELRASGKAVINPYRVEQERVQLVPEDELAHHWPHTYQYLRANKRALERRENGRMEGDRWYGYVYPKNIEVMKCPKLLVPDIADRAAFAIDDIGQYAFTSGYGITLKDSVGESPLYVLGVLNSKVLDPPARLPALRTHRQRNPTRRRGHHPTLTRENSHVAGARKNSCAFQLAGGGLESLGRGEVCTS